MTLLHNIRAQIAEMRAMGKEPKRFVCDSDSFDVLLKEIEPMLLPSTSTSASDATTIFGLRVEICTEPNFEVL